jgi:hypothetical protein
MVKREENKEISNIPGENPFSVPEGYFENFTDRLERRIEKLPKPEPRKISFWKSSKNQLALVAGFLVFVAISYSVMHFVIDGSSTDQLSTTLYAEIIESEIENYDTYMLMEAIENIDEYKESGEEDSYKDEMIEYLVNEDIDMEMIINEF